MFFITLLLITVLAIAGSAAFFSVYGLAAIFSGAFIPVIIMAGSLEVGKLVAASFLYRYWKALSILMRTYLFGAIVVLMFITSVGIFGFLSAAYQQDILPLDEMNTQIQILEDRKQEITELRVDLAAERDRLDAQIDAIPGTHSTNRRKMRESQAADRTRIGNELARLSSEFAAATTEQGNLKRTIVQQEVHTGPIIFIAEALGRDINGAVKWMIILIIFAFDPLAVVLTVGANIAVLKRTEEGSKSEVMGFSIGEKQEQTPETEELDYDKLSEMVASKIHVEEVHNTAPEIDYDEIAKRIQIPEPTVENDKRKEIKQQIRNPKP